MKNKLMIFEAKEQATVSSRVIAEKFERNQRDVLKSIRDLLEGMRKSSQTTNKYFIRSDYKNEQNGQTYPEYLCTLDGFSLLAMGFNGQKHWNAKKIYWCFQRYGIFYKRAATQRLMT